MDCASCVRLRFKLDRSSVLHDPELRNIPASWLWNKFLPAWHCSVRFTVAVVRLSYALTQRVVNANERTLFGSQRRPAGQPICARVCGYAIPLHVNYNKSNSFPRIEYRPPKTDKCTIRTKERCLRTDMCTIRTQVRCLRTVRTVKDPTTPSSWDVEMR